MAEYKEADTRLDFATCPECEDPGLCQSLAECEREGEPDTEALPDRALVVVPLAEFVKMLADEVKANGGTSFVCPELHKRQPVARAKEASREGETA